jgi:hypothetical protein
MNEDGIIINRPIVVVAEEILQQLKELNAKIKEVPTAATKLAETINESKIEYRDADNQSTTKKRKKQQP